MDPVHFHLAVNHIPLAAGLFGMLLTGFGLIRKNTEFQRAGFAVLVIGALAAGPVYLAGREAEERVEHLPGFSENLIEAHEDAAGLALAGLLALGVLAAAALFSTRRARAPGRWSPAVLALSLVVLILTGRAADLGGKIRHPELGQETRPDLHHEDHD